ncbi:DUF4129 domain-containing protein [Candidatus Thorarchaeota archaeon]|nr:MAG: DUF4129 domain-containing protein [Candidatus Thorarchaeota archaeon]
MSAAEPKPKRKMGLTTILSSIFLLLTIIWAANTFIVIQMGAVRTNPPHEKYDDIPPWPYNIEWAGGQSNWFEDVNYTDIPLNQELPPELLEHMEDVVFYVYPDQPPQLWRTGAYDEYDGSSWGKTLQDSVREAGPEIITRSEAEALGNEIYTIVINVTAGPSVGEIELPTLFPTIMVIEDSFTTGHVEGGSYQPDTESRLVRYDLETDDYRTLLFSPLLDVPTGEPVLISYEVTFEEQDLANVAANALEGSLAPVSIRDTYGLPSLGGVSLTQRVIDNITQFVDAGDDAFQTASAVESYFRNTFELMIEEPEVFERPDSGQEVTDWFLERGGGLPMDFATAYCVFMRYLDIPARIAKGYAIGDAQDGYRTLKVKHMMFWAEVFIPMSGSPEGGEWRQVLPLPLPPGMGGGEIPENIEEGDFQLFVWANLPQGWVQIGEEFTLSALLLVDGVPVSTPELITFSDVTDNFVLGSSLIQQGTNLPLANLTYVYSTGATPGLHNITVTYTTPNYVIQNFTSLYVVAQPDPLQPHSSPSDAMFLPAETIDMNIKLGLDNYTGSWEDTVHVHGVMTYAGEPVDGRTLDNDQMQIMWDETWMGNATIQGDGSYELDIFVDPYDSRMAPGPHRVWSSYAGEFGRFSPAQSDNSTITLSGKIEIILSVTPTSTSPGSVLLYDGTAAMLNGTPLALEYIDMFFDGELVDSDIANATGGFSGSYTIPTDQELGIYDAVANWTTTIPGILGNWSNVVPIDVTVRSGSLSIDSTPRDPEVVHPYQNITIYGYLTDDLNGSGLVGQEVDIYWDNGTAPRLIGTVNTTAGGYYELNYTVTVGYLGPVTYWSEFVSNDPDYQGARSSNMTILVERWITEVLIDVDLNVLHPLENVTITGNVTLPEIGWLLANAPVTIWWGNSTGPHNLTVVLTDGVTGQYQFIHQIPYDHAYETFNIWAEMDIDSQAFADDISDNVTITVTYYPTTISVFSNSTYYHLNETAYISGYLQFTNGTPISGRPVDIYWDNGTVLQSFQELTDATGYYNFTYPLDTSDGPGSVTVTVSFTSWTRLYGNCSNTLSPDITLQLYQLSLNANTDNTQYHLDEVITFTGILFFDENGAPISGESITIYYQNSTGTYSYTKWTNVTGEFSFLYNLSATVDSFETVRLWADYTSSNPALWADAQSAYTDVDLIPYELTLTTNTNSTSYHLNETVRVYGQLAFLNGTPIPGETVTLYWDWQNGTIDSYPGLSTNSSGFFNFLYNCSPSKDSAGSVVIWAEYTSTETLLDNASSAPGTAFDLILYQLAFNMDVPSSVYLDESLMIQGSLLYSGGPPLPNADVEIYLFEGGSWVLQDTVLTNSSGGFRYLYNFTLGAQGPGSYDFKCNYTSTSPLDADATTPPIPVNAQRYPVNLDISIGPNPVKLNESLSIYVHLYFPNGTDISSENVSIWWYNGTDYEIGWVLTNSSGENTFIYSGFQEHLQWTAIEVYAIFGGTLLRAANESNHALLQLEQWETLIAGFMTGGSTDYYVSDFVPLNGTLYYDMPVTDIPYAYATLQIVFDGTSVATVSTDINGYFSTVWQIPQSTPAGTHSIWVAFRPSENWIANSSSNPVSLNITALTIIWTIEANPISVYLDHYLNVSGTMTLDNGTPYRYVDVNLYWNHYADSVGQLFLTIVSTDVNGYFQYIFRVNATTPVGITDVWASCLPPDLFVNPSQSDPAAINIEQIPVTLIADPIPTSIYRGGELSVSGTLTFGNGTSMSSYTMELIWGSSVVATDTTSSSGGFTLSYTIPWDEPLELYRCIVRFSAPSEAYEAAQTGDEFVQVRDRVTVTLDDQTVFELVRGDALVVTGTITNGGGGVANVTVMTYANTSSTGESGVTDADGNFSIVVQLPSDAQPGLYFISVAPDTPFIDVQSNLRFWTIQVHLLSEISVDVLTTGDIMPGEPIQIEVLLVDEDGNAIDGTVSISLNNTFIGDRRTNNADWVTLTVSIPTDWARGSGLFVVVVDYEGAGYIVGNSVQSTQSVHIFSEAALDNGTPERIQSGDDLIISGTLYDRVGANRLPITDRTLVISIGGREETVVTDINGDFSHRWLGQLENESIEYTITVLSSANNMTIGSYTVQVQSNTGGLMQSLIDIIVPSIALAGAVIVVLLYLYYVKGMFRSPVKRTALDIPSKLRNIKKLAGAGKYGQAITLAYRTFEQMSGMKIGSERLASETAREYLDRVMKSLPLDSANVEKFMAIYEEARFSGSEMSREQYEEAVRIFTDIYPRIDVAAISE